MAKQVQFKRGTTAQHSTFTGALAEITVDTDKKVAVIHDGTTVGGFPLARADGVVATATTANTLNTANAYTGVSFNSITGLSSTTPIVAGTAAVGTAATAARADHVHPVQTTITGNAGTATALQTARTINGVSFDGTANITVADSTKLSLSGGTMTGAITSLKETKVAMTENIINLSLGNLFTKTLTGNTTFYVNGAASSENVNSFILELTNGGAYTITWFNGIKWAGGIAPTLTASGVDILVFYSHDGGITWRGSVNVKDSK